MTHLTGGFALGVRGRERLSPDAHAEKTLYLSKRLTDFEGLIRFSRTPYLRYPLQVLDKPSVWECLICVATQWGKSTILYSWLNHIVDNDPAATMFVMSTKDQVKDVSSERMAHLFRDSPSFRKHARKIDLFTWQFDEMTVYTGWNSRASVSAHPCKYIILDETHALGKDIRDAAVERGKSKVGMKVLEASSPATETDNIWTGLHLERDRELEKTYEQDDRDHLPVRRYKAGGDCTVHWIYVPCPKCNRIQQLYPDRIWWPRDCSIRDLTWQARYLCIYCDYAITDREKPEIVRACDWRDENGDVPTITQRVGFHSNSLYSLLGDRCTFGEIAAGWIRARRDPEKAATFLKNWCAIPVEATAEETTDAVSFARDADASPKAYRRGTIPDGVDMITVGFDLHKRELYGSIWGWSDADHWRGGWLIDWNVWPCDMDNDPEGVRELMKSYRNTPYQVTRDRFAQMWPLVAGVDSGYRSSDVYRFAMKNPWIYTVKGRRGEAVLPKDGVASAYFTKKRLTKTSDGQLLPGEGVMLYALNTGYLKEEFYTNLSAGVHRLPVDVDQDLLDHLNSEEKVRDVRTGKTFYRKRRMRDVRRDGDDTTRTVKNHWLDTAIYARTAVEILCGPESTADIAQYHYAPATKKIRRYEQVEK